MEDARKIYYQRLQPALYIEGDILLQSFDILAGDLKIDPQKLARVNNLKGFVISQIFLGWLINFSTDLDMILKDTPDICTQLTYLLSYMFVYNPIKKEPKPADETNIKELFILTFCTTVFVSLICLNFTALTAQFIVTNAEWPHRR